MIVGYCMTHKSHIFPFMRLSFLLSFCCFSYLLLLFPSFIFIATSWLRQWALSKYSMGSFQIYNLSPLWIASVYPQHISYVEHLAYVFSGRLIQQNSLDFHTSKIRLIYYSAYAFVLCSVVWWCGPKKMNGFQKLVMCILESSY